MPRNPKSKWTIKAVARAGKGQRQRLEQVIQQERELYNSALQVLESAHQNGTSLELQNLEKQLTQVRREYPEHFEILRRVSISTLKRATTAWNGHANPREGTTPRGKPRARKQQNDSAPSLWTRPYIPSSGPASRPENHTCASRACPTSG